MPAKQRLGPHAERRPPLPRHKPARRGEPGPIGLLEARSRLVAAQDLELMAQHQDLDLLGLAAPEDQHHEREHATASEIRERPTVGNGEEWAGARRGRTVLGSIEGTNCQVRGLLVFSDPTGTISIK